MDGKKNPFQHPPYFPQFLRSHEIFYDKVHIGPQFFSKIMARAHDPQGAPWLIRGNFGHLKYAKIPGVTSKFGMFSLGGHIPSWTVKIIHQFHFPRFLTTKLFENFQP